MDKRSEFLIELADLLDKHSVAMCASLDASEVFFIFNEGNFYNNLKPKRCVLWTSRNHATGGELRIIAQRLQINENKGHE